MIGVDAIRRHAQALERGPLGGEVLLVGRAAGITHQGGAGQVSGRGWRKDADKVVKITVAKALKDSINA